MRKSNIHPTVEQMLLPFFDAIGAQTPTMTAPHVDALPKVKAPVERGLWQPDDKALPALVVDFLNFPVTYGRRDEWGQLMDPDYPAGCEIQAVWLAGHDIYGLLSDEVVSRLETYFGPEKE